MIKDFNLAKTLKELKAELKAELWDHIMGEFHADPLLKSVGYIGYTPDWNDGDVCPHHQTWVVNGCGDGQTVLCREKKGKPDEAYVADGSDQPDWLENATERPKLEAELYQLGDLEFILGTNNCFVFYRDGLPREEDGQPSECVLFATGDYESGY